MDICIVGAGPVGMTLALGLHNQGLPNHGHRITLLEKNTTPSSFAMDNRVYAINPGSVALLERLNIWNDISPFATPIHTVAVREFGSTRHLHFDKTVNPNDAPLGYMVSSATLRQVLHTALRSTQDITFRTGTDVCALHMTPACVHLETRTYSGKTSNAITHTADIVFAADGKHSIIKNSLNLPEETFAYDHHALVCNVAHEKPHNNVALELFTEMGPLAFLPIEGNASACVFSLNHQLANAYKRAEPDVFLDKLYALYPDYGRFSLASPLMSFPLASTFLTSSVSGRVMMCGDAAMSIHPVAGQGLNVGLKDVTAILNTPWLSRNTVGQQLAQIHAQRISDRRSMVYFTDSIIRLFELPSPLVSMMRQVGLTAVNTCPPLKRFFASRAAG